MPAHEVFDVPVQLVDSNLNTELISAVQRIIAESRIYEVIVAKDSEKKLLEFAQAHPEAFNEMVERDVDCFHGATTLNINEILLQGLVPSSLFQRLGIVAIGKENLSQPKIHQGVHVVPVGDIDQTRRFAESRLKVNSKTFVNPKNYQNFLHFSGKKANPYHILFGYEDSFEAHADGSVEEARKIGEAIDRGELTTRSGSPIVFGINSGKISRDTQIVLVDSDVAGDTSVEQIIGFDAIPIIYVEEKEVQNVEAMLEEHGHTNTVVRDIASIR